MLAGIGQGARAPREVVVPLRIAIRSVSFLPLVLALGPVPAAASGPSTDPPPPDVAAFVEAERAFARDAGARGITPAFSAALAPGAILFRPGPVDGHAWLAKNAGDPEARLAWEPEYAEVSVSGDLGWTTGPWDFRRKAGGEPVAFGHYTTVWRRQSDGTLRAVIDAGHSHAKAALAPLAWSRAGDANRAPMKPARSKRASAERALFTAEREFAAAVGRDGWARALANLADEDVRVLREDTLAFVGTEAATAVVGDLWAGTKVGWSAPAGGASDAGDVGYTYGTVTSQGTLSPLGGETYAFLRLWRNPDGKRWRVVLDLLAPAPVRASAPPAAPAAQP